MGAGSSAEIGRGFHLEDSMSTLSTFPSMPVPGTRALFAALDNWDARNAADELTHYYFRGLVSGPELAHHLSRVVLTATLWPALDVPPAEAPRLDLDTARALAPCEPGDACEPGDFFGHLNNAQLDNWIAYLERAMPVEPDADDRASMAAELDEARREWHRRHPVTPETYAPGTALLAEVDALARDFNRGLLTVRDLAGAIADAALTTFTNC
jgi:hypothetical protein